MYADWNKLTTMKWKPIIYNIYHILNLSFYYTYYNSEYWKSQLSASTPALYLQDLRFNSQSRDRLALGFCGSLQSPLAKAGTAP
jgi:hypothetical protein